MTSGTTSWAEWERTIASAHGTDEIERIEQNLFGRKHGAMTLALEELAALSPEERKRKGQELNFMKSKLTEQLMRKRTDLRRGSLASIAQSDRLDVTLDLPEHERGHLHLIPEFIRNVEEVFGRMGFDVSEGPEVETEELNFNLLNIPETHPARDAQDTFWIKAENSPINSDGNQKSEIRNQKLVLRTHTSPGQIRYMRSHKPPFRAIFPGKVYRKDADATHSPMFHQFEGLMVGTDISLANMKAVMITAIRELISKTAEFRFRTGYFPFVEPGLEVDMRWQGDESASREGHWLEIVGCGMVHPLVLKNGGIDPTKWQGFAFGFGVERMIMIKHRIPDLRSFYEGDLRFLRQF